MSNQFLKLRRSAVPGRVPSTSSIDFGEIALNTFDGLAFIKRSGSSGEEVVTLGSREGAFTGSFSGSFVGNGGGLFNIPASGIVGLNLSQIATGSITASVNTGTGSFSLVSGSSTFLFVSSSGNVGIGTNAPSSKLQVVSIGDVALLDSGGVGARVTLKLNTTPASYTQIIGNGTEFNIITIGTTPITFGTNSVERMRLVGSTGNLLLNSTTDSGERLQVSGSSKFAGDMVITGSGTTSATNALLVQNSAGTATFSVRNDGRIANGSTFYLDRYVAGGTVMVISGGGAHNNSTGISVTSGIGIKAYSDVGVSSNNLLGASIYAAGGGYAFNKSLGLLSNRALITSVASGLNMHTSSMLQVDSTDQGFLPPRMTAAQRTAIGTPAQGLVVYDNDLATEGLWYYNSGSNPGWQGVLTNSGSQTISGSITANNITVTGTLTAQTIVAQTITSSTDYVSGSTIFGNSLSNTHQFTGSVSITGSLSVNGGSVPLGSGVAGQVTYWDSANNITGSSNLVWDNANNRLGINTTPGTGNSLHVAGNTFSNTISTNGGINLNRNGDEAYLQFQRDGTATAQLRAINGGGFRITAAAAATEWARFHSTGNFSIGLTFDTGERLQVAGSTRLAGNTFVSGTLDILDAEINYQRNNNVTTGSARLIASIPTASLNAAFFDYVIVSGSNARAGTVTSVWVSSSVEWNETYTNDIGSTSDVTLYSAITGSSIGLFATSSINNVWTIKSLIRTI
jgi:uncharacterized protein YaiE (UPF0345 family)